MDPVQKEMAVLARWFDVTMLVILIIALTVWPKESKAVYEEVQIIHTKIVNIQYCPVAPPGAGNNASQGAYLNNYASGGPVTLQEGLGALAGAAVGGAAGYYIIGGKTATALGAIAGGWTGYNITRPSQSPMVDMSRCMEQPGYAVNFKRIRDGLQGTVIMKSYPTGRNVMINFCPGPQGELDRPC